MHVEIAGHTLGTPDMSLVEALDVFERAELRAAEIIWQDDYEAGLPEFDDGSAVRSLAREARAREIDICCLTPYMTGLNDLDDDIRSRDIRRFERCLSDAEKLSCRRVRVYGGRFLKGDGQREAKWAALVESLTRLGGYAERCGAILVVENHFNTMTMSAVETASLVNDVASPAVGALYDQVNLDFTYCETSPVAIETQWPSIKHVHVKDFEFLGTDDEFRAGDVARVTAEERNVRSRVVGEGTVDWRSILSDLNDRGYEGHLSLEYEYRWHPQDLDPPEQGFARGARHLRALMEEIEE